MSLLYCPAVCDYVLLVSVCGLRPVHVTNVVIDGGVSSMIDTAKNVTERKIAIEVPIAQCLLTPFGIDGVACRMMQGEERRSH